MSTPISALQRNAASVVRKVAASGIAEEITDRGRVVAVLGPPVALGGLERLRHAGMVRSARRSDLEDIFSRIDALPAVTGLLDALDEQRQEEV